MKIDDSAIQKGFYDVICFRCKSFIGIRLVLPHLIETLLGPTLMASTEGLT
jgi:hypothetical protein